MADVGPVLPYIQPGWIGVEIGVSRGDSAKALLDHGVRFLYLVDPWEKYADYTEAANDPDDYWEGIYRECYAKVISQYPSRHAVLRMPSAEAVRFIPPGLDFVWVDGNHRYEWVKSDLELYWPKIRGGGILCGHDYTDNGSTCQVMQAVAEFVVNKHLHLELALPCWVIQK